MDCQSSGLSHTAEDTAAFIRNASIATVSYQGDHDARHMRFTLMQRFMFDQGFDPHDAAGRTDVAMRYIQTGYAGETATELKARKWDEYQAAGQLAAAEPPA